MEGILKFNLPEEQDEFITAQNGINYKIVIEDLSAFLRSKTKYGDLTEDQHKIYDEVRSKLAELSEDHQVLQYF